MEIDHLLTLRHEAPNMAEQVSTSIAHLFSGHTQNCCAGTRDAAAYQKFAHWVSAPWSLFNLFLPPRREVCAFAWLPGNRHGRLHPVPDPG